jgi:hypothetical protein
MASYNDEALGSDSSCRALVHRFAREDFMGHYIVVLDAGQLLRSTKERNAVKVAQVSGIVGGGWGWGGDEWGRPGLRAA